MAVRQDALNGAAQILVVGPPGVAVVGPAGPEGPAGPVGGRGPQGPAGAGAISTRTATVTVPAWCAVIEDGAGCRPADPTNPAHYGRVLGVTAAGGAAGTVVNITKIGDLTGSAGPFASGKTLWIGAGGVLAEAPVNGDWRQSVGVATATDRIVVTPEPPARIVVSSGPLTPAGQFVSKATTEQTQALAANAWLDPATLSFDLGIFNINRYRPAGGTDRAAILSTMGLGRTVYIPFKPTPYSLGQTISLGDMRCNFLIDPLTRFDESGDMPELITNTFQKITGNYFYQKAFTGGQYGKGMQTLGVEVEADPSYEGNPVALYAGAVTPGLVPLKCNMLAFNTVATANPGPLAGGSIVNTELDYNNFNSDNFGGVLHLTGISSYNPQYAILIDHLYDPSKAVHYEVAVVVRNFRTGILIDGTTQSPADTTANAVGIRIQGIKENLMVLTPSDDSPGAIFHTTNADASQAPFILSKNGDVTSQGNIKANGVLTVQGIIEPVSAPPASATAPGVPGQRAWDTQYEYRCVAENTWRRAALSAW